MLLTLVPRKGPGAPQSLLLLQYALDIVPNEDISLLRSSQTVSVLGLFSSSDATLFHSGDDAASPVLMLQGLLLSAYLKMLLADPSDDQLRQQVGAVYERYSHFMDADLQQRAVEYQGLLKLPEIANRNVTAMPKWEKRKSLLLRRMAEKEVCAHLQAVHISAF